MKPLSRKNAGGFTKYNAFWIIDGQFYFPTQSIFPGDRMSISVSVTSAGKVSGTIKDLSTAHGWSQHFSGADTIAPSRRDAQWIVQDADEPLADFGTIKTSGDTASLTTHSGSIGSFSSISGFLVFQITMIDSSYSKMASPSSLSSGGSSFSIKWVASS